MFVANRVRRLLEQEELVFGGRERRISHVLGAHKHAFQRGSGADRLGGSRELGQKQQSVAFERQRPAGCGIDHALRIGVRRMPSGEADVVVELIARIPAEHDVAETEAAIECRQEFLGGEVFPPQHAVHIENPELDVAHAAFMDDLRGIGRGPDLVRHLPVLGRSTAKRSEGGITTRVTKHPLRIRPPRARRGHCVERTPLMATW